MGDSLMYVLIGADIRPRCIDALQKAGRQDQKRTRRREGDLRLSATLRVSARSVSPAMDDDRANHSFR